MASIGEIIRATISYSHPNGSVAQNVFYWELQDSDESDTAVLDALDDWFDLDWVPTWDNFADSAVQLFLMEVDVVNGDGTVARNIGEEIQAHVGAAAGEAASAGVAAFIQASTERAKSLGRKYIPGISETFVEDGAITPAVVALLVILAAEWITSTSVGVSGNLVPGVLSRVTLAFLEFTGSVYTTDVPAYQRRRKPNVGS